MHLMKVDPRALKENSDRSRQTKSTPQAEAECGGSCLHGACSEPASGVPGLDDRPFDRALHEHAS